MNYKVIPFDSAHLELLELREIESGYGMFVPDFKERMAGVAKTSEIASTFLYDGRIIAVMGFFSPWQGVVQGWIIPTVYIKTVPVSFPRMVKRYIEQIAKTFKCHRFQAGSFNDPFHARWMEFLGFEVEGIKRKFTPDKRDYVDYVRFFDYG